METLKPVYIVDGNRTPFLKAQSKVGPGPFPAAELGVQCARSLLLRQACDTSFIDEVIVGCTTPSESEMNIARVIGLRSGIANSTPAWTVHRNCASGLQAIDSGLQSISLGRSNVVLCGGVDSLSQAPFIYSKNATKWFTQLSSSKNLTAKIKKLLEFRPQFFKPIIGILKGLTDPVEGIGMGQTAENLVKKFGLSREMIDEYSVQSHKRATQYLETVHFQQINAIFDANGNGYSKDDGIREDISLEKLLSLKPVFDRPDGNITAGNSSQITDGASMLILSSEEGLKTMNTEPLAEITQINWAGLDPKEMGLGPVHAFMPILQQQKMKKSDIDLWEINEAFAAQVLGCQKALNDQNYCKEQLSIDNTFGEIDNESLNVAGGAIAIGHPVAASGARILLNIIHLLKNKKLKTGMVSICIGGGMGGAAHVKLC